MEYAVLTANGSSAPVAVTAVHGVPPSGLNSTSSPFLLFFIFGVLFHFVFKDQTTSFSLYINKKFQNHFKASFVRKARTEQLNKNNKTTGGWCDGACLQSQHLEGCSRRTAVTSKPAWALQLDPISAKQNKNKNKNFGKNFFKKGSLGTMHIQ